MFSPANEVICLVNTGCSFVKMKSHYLNPSFVLKLLAVTSQSIITVIAHILSTNLLGGCFLIHPLVHIYGFYDLKDVYFCSCP